MLSPVIKIIAAKTKNNVIGIGNKIPWHSKTDFIWFKEQTKGHVVLMGKNTFSGMGNRPLKDRVNVVLSSAPKEHEPERNLWWFTNIPDALAFCSLSFPEKTVWVCGGRAVYDEFMSDKNLNCSEMVITEFDLEIDLEKDGLVEFPIINGTTWQVTSSDHGIDETFKYPAVSLEVMSLGYRINVYTKGVKE